MSFWKHRVDMRELVQSIDVKKPNELQRNLPQLKEDIADKLEMASVFRKTKFPNKFRKEVSSVEDLNAALEELYEFSDEEKIWLGVGT